MSDPLLERTLADLVLANRILAHEDVIDDFGHVSVRHPHDPGRYFLSRSRSPELVTRDDIMEFTLDGTPIDANNRRPYLERVIHGAIYAARPGVHAVSHHHARAVLPFAAGLAPLRPVFHMAACIGPHVPVWDSQAEFGDTNMLVETPEQGASLARALGDASCVLLRAHGATCVGATLNEVAFTSIYMKENAELQLRMMQFGEPSFLTPGEIDQAWAMFRGPGPARRTWEYRVSRAGFPGVF